MSMTREEAITCLQEKYDYCKSFYDLAAHPEEDYPEMAKYLQALQIALTALRPITREQVEQVWKGEWKCQSDCGVTECTACKWNIEEYCGDYNFCPHCGAPMNDEAIQMVMERLEEMYK